jgi:DNA invertase Pin-like site-specific DNA recombinase
MSNSLVRSRVLRTERSQRTSAALKAAKARGKRLGNPKLSQARRRAAVARKEKADHFSANVAPLIREIQASGAKSLRGVARALAARGIPTARFKHACKLGLEGIVSKRKDSPYRSGQSPDWLKMKNPACAAVKREEEEGWGK